MVTRRRFVGWTGIAAAGAAFGMRGIAQRSSAAARSSVMMWTLKGRGTFEQNLEVVARAGYRHVELVDEWTAWSEADWTRVLARMQAFGVSVDAISAMGLDFAAPGGSEAFATGLERLLPVAKRLGARQVILLSGPVVAGAGQGLQFTASVEALRRAATVLAAAGLVGVIEPIDRLEQPKIYLDGVTEAFAMVEAVASPAVKVLYDLYHEQRTHGNLIEKLEKHISDVGLVHVADVPGRHQPGSGEVDYMPIYKTLARLGYRGVVAMEFYPVGDAVEVLRRARVEFEATFAG